MLDGNDLDQDGPGELIGCAGNAWARSQLGLRVCP